MNKTILDEGFLSADMMDHIKSIRATYSNWFEFIGRLNIFGELLTSSVTATIKVGDVPDAKLVAFLLSLRTMSNFQGVVLLAERGMVVEARTLVRCCLENLFFIEAVAKDPSFVSKFLDDSDFSAMKRLRLLVQRPAVSQHLLPSKRAELLTALNELESKPKPSALNLEAVSLIADMPELYVFYRQLCADAAHPSVQSLDRYMPVDALNGGGIITRTLPDSALDDVPDTLQLAAMATLGAIASLIGHFNLTQFQQEFSILHEKFTEITASIKKRETFRPSLLVPTTK